MALQVTDYKNIGPTTGRTTKTTLGKDDFLLLLTKQLQNQDPMKPMDNMEFVSQMAQFSSLEQMTNMNKSLETFLNNANNAYKTDAMSMLGAFVIAQNASMPEPVQGYVTKVRFVDGEALLTVGGKDYKIPDIHGTMIPNSEE